MSCLISMIIAILIPYILFQTMVYCLFFSKIFGETQDEVSIFSLLHTIIIIYFFNYYHSFFHKIFVGGLVFGDEFLVLIRDGVIWGRTHDRDGVRWGGLGKKWPLRPKMPPYVLQHNKCKFWCFKYKIELSMQFWAKKKSKLRENHFPIRIFQWNLAQSRRTWIDLHYWNNNF